MGCDIHCHSEVKIAGVWHHLNEIDVNRNYRLFSMLAGVRLHPDVPQQFPVRGIPDDATVVTRMQFDSWGDDAHTPSWISAEEVRKVHDHFHVLIFGYFLGWNWMDEDLKAKGVEDARVVFWFDN